MRGVQGNTKEEWAFLVKSRNTVKAENEALQVQINTLAATLAHSSKLLRDAQVDDYHTPRHEPCMYSA